MKTKVWLVGAGEWDFEILDGQLTKEQAANELGIPWDRVEDVESRYSGEVEPDHQD